MKTKITVPGLFIGLSLWFMVQNTGYSAPPVTPVPTPPISVNPNINGPPPGSHTNNANTPNGLGQPYTMGNTNVGGFNGNPNINGPAPGIYINGTNAPSRFGQPYNLGTAQAGSGYTAGNTNRLGSSNQSLNDYTNPNGTVTYNTNSPHWWVK
jgi:hypothetical protein